MSINIFTNDRLLVSASHIVPFDTISIIIVEDSHTGLSVTMQLCLLSVVRLRYTQSTCVGPVMEPSGAIGGWHGHLVSRPEPTIDVLWEEIRSVTTIKVTQTARGPEVWHIGIHESLDPVILLRSLE